MKKPIRLLIALSLLISHQFSFAQVTEWVRTEAAGFGISQCTDQFNYVYSVGQYVGSVQVGSNSFTSAGLQDIAVTKMDPNGTILWVISMGGSNGEFSKDMVYDGLGGVWVCGQFSGTMQAGNLTINSAGGIDGFLIKIDAATGQVVFAQNLGSTQDDDALALKSDQSGHIYLAGFFRNAITLGGYPLIGQGSMDTYLYKLDFLGNVLWGTGVYGTGIETMWSLAIDNLGNSYIAGHHNSATSTFGTTQHSIPNPNKYIVKFDALGNSVWVASAIFNGEIDGITVDDFGNVYYTGNFDTQADMGTITLTGNGLDDILIGKIGPTGNHLWAKNIGGTGNDSGIDIICNALGDLFVLCHANGIFNFDGFAINAGASNKIVVAKLDGSGTAQWAIQSQGASFHSSSQITQSITDEIYVTGYGSGAFNIGGQSSTLTGTYIAKIYDNANHIEGTVFNDLNSDGIWDTGENGLPNVIVELNNQFFVCPSNALGLYNLYCGPGNQTASIPNPPLYYTFSTPSSHTVNFTGMGNTSSSNNFGLVATPNMNDLSIDIVGVSNPKVGHILAYQLTYKNQGTTTQNATVTLSHDGQINFVSCAPAYNGYTGTTLEWNLGTLNPQQMGTITVHFYIPTSLNVGNIVSSSSLISPVVNDQTSYNNTATISQTIVGPYDPNYKIVNIDTIFASSGAEWLDYTIHFQNIGSDTAHNVIIVDTLSHYLNPAYFEIISHSHPNLILNIKDGYVVEFRFNQIMLPDSSTDPIGSMGFVKYRIQHIPILPLFATIENFADIYFDYEEAVRTDTATTYHAPLASVQSLGNNSPLLLYPNPANHKIYIQLPELICNQIIINIYSLNGGLVYSWVTGNNDGKNIIEVDINQLNNGAYFVELVTSETIIRSKLIKY